MKKIPEVQNNEVQHKEVQHWMAYMIDDEGKAACVFFDTAKDTSTHIAREIGSFLLLGGARISSSTQVVKSDFSPQEVIERVKAGKEGLHDISDKRF